MPRPLMCLLCLLLLGLFVAPVVAVEEDEEDADYLPGLSAVYSSGKKTIRRIDPDIEFAWGTASPDPRLPVGPFQAKWQGRLLLQEPSTYRFSAYVQGQVTITLDGKEVLSGQQQQPGWINGPPLEFDFGEFELDVQYKKTGKAGLLKLFWSADRFDREPLPARFLYRNDAAADLKQIERGQTAFAAHRCNRCHRREQEQLSAPAPSLEQAAGGLSRDWIVDQLSGAAADDPHANMPQFGFDRTQADSIAAFLLQGDPVATTDVPAIKDETVARREGEILLRSVGCLACHTHGEYGTISEYTGGDLSQIGKKRSRDWIYTWLAHPEKLNRDHRMPVVKLSKEERAQLALYLTPTEQSTDQGEPPQDSAEKIEAGRALVRAARCANCHRIPGVNENLAGIPRLSSATMKSAQSCLSAQPKGEHSRPFYPHVDPTDIAAYVAAHGEPLAPIGEFKQGRQLLVQRNCLNCHERDLGKGIVAIAGKMSRVDETLQGQSEALIPPALTAVGDKLKDDALSEAVSGEQKKPRLPWLKVRMPRFQHTDAEKQALTKFLIGHDRIPDFTSEPPAEITETERRQALIAGHELVGGKGFSCVACHAFGKFEPRNVALGTRGSDLLMLGQRMRREYFLRWTRSPLRIVPGMEMPSFDKPVPKILAGDHDRQLAAIWDGLNDPNFTVPTNPSVVEQYLVVRPDEPPRIVRDVFTNHEADSGYTPRSFAVGLPNRHNVLYDLDTFSLRQWWLGDFARQRTQGKSWFWDAAGVTIAVGTPNAPDIALRADGTAADALLIPTRDQGTHGRLVSYHTDSNGVQLEYVLNFANDRQLHVTETIRPVMVPDRPQLTGWTRRISVSGIPEGFQAVLLHRSPEVAFGNPLVEVADESATQWEAVSADGKTQGSVIDKTGDTALGAFRYLCELKPEELGKNPATPSKFPIEKITSVPGYDGIRLPLSRSIMPTAIAWTHDGKMVFTSLKGHVYIAEDTDGDGIEDELKLFEEGLAAAYGVIADGADLIVAHKPELLRLRDTDGDGRADVREVVATGWGFNDNYHDWTTGIVRDSAGNLYVGLGSDYAQKKRRAEHTRWRGKVLRIDPSGKIEPLGHDLRYPTGLAIDQEDRVYMSDQQGVQNTFNEINHLVPGRGYGVTSPHRDSPDSPPMWPAVQLPHPWTRSVNGIFFLNSERDTKNQVFGPFAGHGIGCEYDTRALIRFTTQQVGDVLQGAAYRLSRTDIEDATANFTGALSGAVGPDGDIYIGSIHDSGWLGGHNLGDIVRLRPNGKLPLGIRELRANPQGFTLTFTAPVNRAAAADPENYTISAYTRVWEGGYATPESGRHKVTVTGAQVSADGREVVLTVDALQEKFVYEVSCGRIGPDANQPLWPSIGYYTMTVVPKK